MTYVIRKLTYDDYDNFIQLIRDFRDTFFNEPTFKNILDKINLTSDIWVIECNDILIATATIIYEYKFIYNGCILGHIEDVCVKKEYRGQGFGKIIITELINQAKLKNCYKLILDCAENNIKFYEICGLEKRGTQMSYLFFDPALPTK